MTMVLAFLTIPWVGVCVCVVVCVRVCVCQCTGHSSRGTSILPSSIALFRLRLRCRVLQCVAVCCSVLQCVAVYCSVLQCVAV